MSEMPKDASNCMENVEKFVVLMYDKSSSNSSVDVACKELFTKKRRFFDRLPPTRATLYQHVLRSAYQAGYFWGQCLVLEPILRDPPLWGWTKTCDNTEWEPLWTTNPEASIACRELLSCVCKSCDTNHCKSWSAEKPLWNAHCFVNATIAKTAWNIGATTQSLRIEMNPWLRQVLDLSSFQVQFKNKITKSNTF